MFSLQIGDWAMINCSMSFSYCGLEAAIEAAAMEGVCSASAVYRLQYWAAMEGGGSVNSGLEAAIRGGWRGCSVDSGLEAAIRGGWRGCLVDSGLEAAIRGGWRWCSVDSGLEAAIRGGCRGCSVNSCLEAAMRGGWRGCSVDSGLEAAVQGDWRGCSGMQEFFFLRIPRLERSFTLLTPLLCNRWLMNSSQLICLHSSIAFLTI